MQKETFNAMVNLQAKSMLSKVFRKLLKLNCRVKS